MSAELRLKIFEATSHNKDDVLKELYNFVESTRNDRYYDSHNIETTSALVSYDEENKKPIFAYSFCVKYKYSA